MQNIVHLSLIAIASFGLTACVVKENPAHTKIYYPGAGTVDYHCPPGHRKKGEC